MPTNDPLTTAAQAIARHLETLVKLERARLEKLDELILIERDRLELAKQPVFAPGIHVQTLGEAQR